MRLGRKGDEKGANVVFESAERTLGPEPAGLADWIGLAAPEKMRRAAVLKVLRWACPCLSAARGWRGCFVILAGIASRFLAA